MSRAVTMSAVVALIAAACSSAGEDAGGSAAGAAADPTATFCDDWDRFDQLTNSDDDPTAALVQEIVGLQDSMGQVLPDELAAAWVSILAWNEPFIEYFQTTGYRQPADDVIFDLLGGEAAAEAAAQGRNDAYETIRTWSRDNCSAGFCDLWPAYDEFIETDIEPTEELIGQLLEMQGEIDNVLPPELTASWAGIVDWNQAFIDVFERLGYQSVTSELFLEAFDSDDDAAGAAEEALEGGFATIRSWADQNCNEGSEHAVTFCAEWDEFAALTADEVQVTPESYDAAIAAIDRVGVDVPPEVESDWNAVVESAHGFHDVLVSVNFEPHRITDGLLEQAFGGVEAAAEAEEAAHAGRAAIDDWSLTACGGVCSRWPELRQALEETGRELNWVLDSGEESGVSRVAEHLRQFEIGNRHVPDEVRGAWDTAVAARRDWIGFWESFGYEGAWYGSREGIDRGLEVIKQAPYLIAANEFVDVEHLPLGPDHRRVIAAWQDGADRAPVWLSNAGEFDEQQRRVTADWLNGTGEPPDWIAEFWHWGPNGWFGGQLTAALEEWVGDNCDAVTDRPGTVAARYPRIEGAAGDTLVLALMPLGATVEDLADQTDVLAGTCAWIHDDPSAGHRDGEGEPFRAERWEEGGWCDFREEAPVRVDAGPYTMLAAVIEGRPGREFLGTSSACLAFDVQIDSDTVIDVPRLPPCDVDLGGSDDPWRNPPPVDPATPGAGTLQIVFPDMVGDGQGGEVFVVVLPAGTTLNDVGREQVWPAGATRTWLIDPGFATERGTRAVTVPIAEVPATGSARALEPHWLAENPPLDRLPLAVLAGTYDIHVQVIVPDPPDIDYSGSFENDRCGTFEVTIAGDTVVDLPELGECPRVA